MKTRKQNRMNVVKFKGGYLEWCPIITGRDCDTIDPIPEPSHFNIKAYNYLSYVLVNEKSRGKGKAKQAIEKLLGKTHRSFLIILCNFAGHNGFVMKRMLRRFGFRSCPELNRKLNSEFCYMFLRRGKK